MVIVININIIILRIIIIITISVIFTIIFLFIYLLTYYLLFIYLLLFLFFSIYCYTVMYSGGSKAPIRLSERGRSCLVYTKPGIFGLAIVPKEIYSRLFNSVSN